MLERLGIHGYGSIERALLAGVALGEPTLLWGPHGAAKTELCRRVSAALGLRFWAYDASKSLFEDLLGFPNPAALAAGTVDYVRTPISIWDKQAILIDELNRANPQLQSKWLEVIHARQLMGCPLRELALVFAAMNPPTYLGTNPLDEALAGRFATILRVPVLSEMSDGDARAVIDARPGATPGDEDARAVRELVLRARERSLAAPAKVLRGISDYVFEVVRLLGAREVAVDGRRAGMIARLCAARLAVEAELAGGEVALGGPPLLEALLDEADQLVAIFGKSLVTLRGSTREPPALSTLDPATDN